MASEGARASNGSTSVEESIITPLRGLILVIIALGVLAAIVGSAQMRWFIPIFYLPVAVTYKRPRWSQILIWIMWSVTWGMLAMILAIGGRPALFTVPSHWLLASASAVLCVALPCARWYLESPHSSSRIPQARVHRRE
jgi:hypothetical protein